MWKHQLLKSVKIFVFILRIPWREGASSAFKLLVIETPTVITIASQPHTTILILAPTGSTTSVAFCTLPFPDALIEFGRQFQRWRTHIELIWDSYKICTRGSIWHWVLAQNLIYYNNSKIDEKYAVRKSENASRYQDPPSEVSYWVGRIAGRSGWA